MAARPYQLVQLGLALGLNAVLRDPQGQDIFPVDATEVFVAFALPHHSPEEMLNIYGLSGFDPQKTTFLDLSQVQIQRFTENSKPFRSVYRALADLSGTFWSSYEAKHHMKTLENKVRPSCVLVGFSFVLFGRLEALS